MLVFLLVLPLVVFVVGKIPFFRHSGIKPNAIRGLFVLKILAGLAVLWVYENYYPKDTADIFNYYKDGEVLHSVLKRSPSDYLSILTGINDERPHLYEYYDEMAFWIKPFDYNLYNDNKPIIRLNALFRLVSGGNIYLHVIGFNLLALFGLVGMFMFFRRWVLGRNQLYVLLVLFFTPTVLFWGSGMLKESFLIFVLGGFLWLFDKVLFGDKRPIHFIGLIVFAYLMTRVKIYVLLSLLPSLFWLVYRRINQTAAFLSFLGTHVGLLIIAFLVGYFFPDYNWVDIVAGKQNDFINFTTELAPAGSTVDLPRLSNSFFDIVKLLPLGLINALCRPHILEAHNAMSFFAAIENLFINAILVLSILFFNPNKAGNPLVWVSLSFASILMVLTGITTPVLGALVRYKMPALPFLLIAAVIIGGGWRQKKPISRRKQLVEYLDRLEERLCCFFFSREQQ